MQAAEIARRLADDAERVAAYLLPQGRRDGQEWRVGSIDGEPGKSLGIHLTGDKAGIWADFAGDGRGDLVDLWRAVRGVDLPTAMQEACGYLGIAYEPEFASGKAQPCVPMERPQVTKPRDQVADWLEDRGISTAAADAYRLASSNGELVLPYLRDGELVAIKYRNLVNKGRMRVERGGAMPLFGWQAIPDDARSVVITEGELDAVACWQMGYPALSVPNGAQGMTWVEVEYGALERFDLIYVWMDADEEGRKAARKIVDRLGAERCRVVEQGVGKDANDALLKRLDATQLIMRARTIDPVELKSAGEFVDEVIALFYPADDYEPGIRMPWDKADDKILLRPSEVTVVCGINGHGKSILTSQVALDACAQGTRCCIASMEMPARWTLQRMSRQAAGISAERPSIPFIHAIHEWLSDKLWLFAVTGTAKADRMLEVFRYARKRYDITLFVVDSLAKCGIAEDDYNGQKAIVDKLHDFALETDSHVLLVVHPRKSASEHEAPGKMDVRGAQSITDMADNGCTLWRNKRKEEIAHRDHGHLTESEKAELDKPDAFLDWWKSRNGAWEGKLALWWHSGSQQFIPFDKARPRVYVEYSAREASA